MPESLVCQIQWYFTAFSRKKKVVCEWDMTEICKRCFCPVLKFLRSYIRTATGRSRNEWGGGGNNRMSVMQK